MVDCINMNHNFYWQFVKPTQLSLEGYAYRIIQDPPKIAQLRRRYGTFAKSFPGYG